MYFFIKFGAVIAKNLNFVIFLAKIERNAPKAIKMYYIRNYVLCKIFQISKYIDLGFKFLGHIWKQLFLGCYEKRNFTLEQE